MASLAQCPSLSVQNVIKHAHIVYNVLHILTRSKGSQTPWNMECALASMVHKISKPEIFSQPDRFSHIAFHIPSVTQYRHCRLNDKQRLLQETLGKWSLRILLFALTIPQVLLRLHSLLFQLSRREAEKGKMGQKRR